MVTMVSTTVEQGRSGGGEERERGGRRERDGGQQRRVRTRAHVTGGEGGCEGDQARKRPSAGVTARIPDAPLSPPSFSLPATHTPARNQQWPAVPSSRGAAEAEGEYPPRSISF